MTARKRPSRPKPPPAPNQDPMKFDLDEVVIPVSVGDKEYVLREASGQAAVTWRNAIFSKTKLGPDGKPIGFGAMAEIEPLLVSLCLYNGDGRNVPEQEVRKWPARIQKALFERAKDISDLDEEDDSNLEELYKQRKELDEKITKLEKGETAAKNGQADTTDGY